ncbi:hypothetical protein E2R56_27655 [Rhodococcus qingshengii]|nr:hypothetical protein E2R56_27655 [Rhodococcus qingshengii]
MDSISFSHSRTNPTKGFRITSIVISLLILGYFAYNHFSSNEKEVLVSVINTSSYSIDKKVLKENIEGLKLPPKK